MPLMLYTMNPENRGRQLTSPLHRTLVPRAGEGHVSLLHHTKLPHLPLYRCPLCLSQPEIDKLVAVLGIRPQGNRFDLPRRAGLKLKTPDIVVLNCVTFVYHLVQ